MPHDAPNYHRSLLWVALLIGLGLPGCAGNPASDTRATRCPLAPCDAGVDSSDRFNADSGNGPAATRAVLVTVEQLDEQISASEPHIVDAREETQYSTAHLPSAVNLDGSTLRTEINGVSGQVPPPEDVAAAFRNAGLQLDSPVVVYGAQSDLAAARLFWTLEYMGHGDVQLLDGGLTQWQNSGYPLETAAQNPMTTAFPADTVQTERRVDASWILDRLDDPDVILIDARSTGEYDAAHIPGARHFDWQRNLEAGRLKPKAELESMYAGVGPEATIAVYCQTGSRASMAYFVLRYLGYEVVRLYDGSMADWTTDPNRPLE